MKLLLDTHTLLWWLADDARLGQRARDWIANPGNLVLVSAASLWEGVVKIRVGTLEAEIGQIIAAIDDQGFVLLGVDRAHLQALVDLPRLPDHRDPFDHLLVAQANAEGATLLSEDRNIPRYAVAYATCSDPPASR